MTTDHFRTDVSFLPDLQAYLADLLRSRERLMSAFAADDWACSEATPSQEEIRRVRRLIERVRPVLTRPVHERGRGRVRGRARHLQ